MENHPTKVLNAPRPLDVQSMTTADLRSTFLIDQVFPDDRVSLVFTELDRLTVGGAKPTTAPLTLPDDKQTGTAFFLERRELGIINIGGAGRVIADGKKYEVGTQDCLYVGMGTRKVTFESHDRANPAKFYLNSCPAHATHPTTLATKKDTQPRELGSQATANRRRIFQYIHQNGIKSCQLVMGFTELDEGSVWNTMPPHTHLRRTEIYLYFDLGSNVVSHFMGPPQNTRHVWVKNEEAVLSPSWSIHAGCGTAAYRFIWAMGGENQTFDDMDAAPVLELR